MGKENNRDIDGDRKNTAGADGPDTESTSTETGSGKRGRGRPRKSDTTATENNIPQLVLVEEPGGGTEEEAGPQPSAKAPKRKRKDVNTELKKDQIAVLIKTTFDIIASREGLELWKLSQQESEAIGEPLAQILNKNPFIAGAATKYGDLIALIAAIATVIIPRLFVQFAADKEKKKKEVPSYVPIRQINDKQSNKNEPAANRNESGTLGNSTKQSNRKPTVTGSIFSPELYNILPAIQ